MNWDRILAAVVDQMTLASGDAETAIAADVPDQVKSLPIFKDPKGPKLWKKLADAEGIQNLSFLGKGTRGSAFGVNDVTYVLKLTTDQSEAEASSLIMQNQDPDGRVAEIFNVYKLVGAGTNSWAVTQELLSPLDPENPKDERWAEWADFWPAWSRRHNYAKMNDETSKMFLDEYEKKYSLGSEQEWREYRQWFTGLASYLHGIGVQYHDFWHRNLLKRGDQFVAIDFGYSLAEEPDSGFSIDTISKKNS